jgi:N,N'-diacetyllegionaminate synthase
LSSGDLTNLGFLRYVSSKGKPLIVSTGMATLDEVELAVHAIASSGSVPYALLHCVSAYPAPPSSVNLRAMATLARAFRVPVGFSDHTEGCEIALASVALGACIVEKHFTTDRNLSGPDHRASLEPGQLRDLVRGIRAVESSLGDGRKVPTQAESAMAAVARRSLVASRRVEAGAKMTDADLIAKRPGTGISPGLVEQVIGREARVMIPEGSVIAWEMFA